MKNQLKKEPTPLSASRIKTFKSCSWSYYCNYILKMPQKNNSGAQRGSICHDLFEHLGTPRHEHYVQEVLDAGLKMEDRIPAIQRYVALYARQMETLVKEDEHLCYEMIYNSLGYDFFGEMRSEDGKTRPDVSFSEKDFDMTKLNDDGSVKYRVRGFIDKLFMYSYNKTAFIRDFKTSKKTFEGVEVTDNMQDYMYSLACRELFPEFSNRSSEFLFLKFDMNQEDIEGSNGVIVMEPISPEKLSAFEDMLGETQKKIDSFDETTATSNFAKHQFGGGFPPKEAGFAGKLSCGCFCKRKGQRKKADNSIMWHCAYRFDFNYYVMLDKDGNQVASAFEEDYVSLYLKKKEGYSIEYREYNGCPAWAR